MVAYIPFANTTTGASIVKAFYADASAVRITLDKVASLKAHLPHTVPLWLDPAFEGLSLKTQARGDEWQKFISTHPGHEKFDDPTFLANPAKTDIQAFVERLMNDCMAHKPSRITIPQFPVDLDPPPFKLNRLLAEAAMKWRSTANKQVDLILPVVFTHQTQLANKAARNKVLSHIKSCLSRGQFEGLWSVDSSLADQDGTGNFDERFKCNIKFSEEVREILGPNKHLTAGPHWGLNLVLWARGLVDHPAIGLGFAFQYHVHGGKSYRPNTRVALAPLRRWATYSPDLKQWLVDNIPHTPPASHAHNAFRDLQAKFPGYIDQTVARRQIAHFYREWFHSIYSTPLAGRALALYQDLSSAYVLGKNLGQLPANEKTARRPERVAQQLMLHCL